MYIQTKLNLDVAFIYRINNFFWKTNFTMEFIPLVSQCSFLCIKSIPVSINISLALLEEFPDSNNLA